MQLLVPVILFQAFLCQAIEIFVINLERRPERLASCYRQLNALHQPFTRFNAIDGMRLKIYPHNKNVKFPFHPETKADLEQCYEEAASQNFWGVFGAWQSHLQLYLQLRDSGSEGPFLILEDDVLIEADAFEYLDRTLERLPADWDLFFPGWCTEELDGVPDLESEFRRIKRCYCLHAYVVRGVEVLGKLIERSNQPTIVVADHVTKYGTMEGVFNSYISWPHEYIMQDRKTFETDIPTSGLYLQKFVRKKIKPWKMIDSTKHAEPVDSAE